MILLLRAVHDFYAAGDAGAAASLFAPATIAMAIVIAGAGALQYWPNLQQFASARRPRHVDRSLRRLLVRHDESRLARFDGHGRAARSSSPDGSAMWWFDARQQFGAIGLFARGSRRRPALDDFAAVGDARGPRLRAQHGLCIHLQRRRHSRVLPARPSVHRVSGGGGDLSIWRVQTDPPSATEARDDCCPSLRRLAGLGHLARDRSSQRSPCRSTRDAAYSRCEPADGVLVTDLNWQLENALLYYSRWQRRDIPWVRLLRRRAAFPVSRSRQRGDLARHRHAIPIRPADVVAAFGPAASRFSRIRYEHRPIFSMRFRAWHAARRTSCAC